jgi:hypothetical protein
MNFIGLQSIGFIFHFLALSIWPYLRFCAIPLAWIRADMALITEEQRLQLLANGVAAAQGRRGDFYPVVKLFTPDAHATWLLTELDPADADTAYGLCDVGLGVPELAHVKLSDLEAILGPQRLPVERDLHFKPRRCLSEYASLALKDGSIND